MQPFGCHKVVQAVGGDRGLCKVDVLIEVEQRALNNEVVQAVGGDRGLCKVDVLIKVEQRALNNVRAS